MVVGEEKTRILTPMASDKSSKSKRLTSKLKSLVPAPSYWSDRSRNEPIGDQTHDS